MSEHKTTRPPGALVPPGDPRLLDLIGGPRPAEGHVRRLGERVYVTLGGLEHGMDEAAATRLMWALARTLLPGETLCVSGERRP